MSNTKMSDVFDLPLTANCHGQIKEGDGKFAFGGASTREEDTKAIALAVNNHDKLVGMLETMTDWVEYYDSDVKDIDAAIALLQAIKGDQ